MEVWGLLGKNNSLLEGPRKDMPSVEIPGIGADQVRTAELSALGRKLLGLDKW